LLAVAGGRSERPRYGKARRSRWPCSGRDPDGFRGQDRQGPRPRRLKRFRVSDPGSERRGSDVRRTGGDHHRSRARSRGGQPPRVRCPGGAWHSGAHRAPRPRQTGLCLLKRARGRQPLSGARVCRRQSEGRWPLTPARRPRPAPRGCGGGRCGPRGSRGRCRRRRGGSRTGRRPPRPGRWPRPAGRAPGGRGRCGPA